MSSDLPQVTDEFCGNDLLKRIHWHLLCGRHEDNIYACMCYVNTVNS
jgi:hypothetical protein